MSWLKNNFAVYMKNSGLSWNKARAALDNDGWEPPDIDVSDGRELTWKDIETLTGGRMGKIAIACPFCGSDNKDSRRFQIDRWASNKARYRCFYCGESGAIARDGPIDPAEERAARAAKEDKDVERTSAALRWWEEGASISNSPYVREFFEARAIFEMPPNVDEVLRWHRRCTFGGKGTERDILLALFRDALTDEPRAILRTWIKNAKAGVAERMALGPIDRAVIKLWPLGSYEHLFVAEGLETALAVSNSTWDGEPARPIWAASVANNLKKLPVLPGVKSLIVMADNDPSQTGLRAAKSLVQKWKIAGHEAKISMPKNYKDWNDFIMENSK